MDIRLEYSLTADDFREFNLAYLKHRKALTPRSARMPTLRLVFWLVLLVAVPAVVLVNIYSPSGSAPAPPASPTPLKDLWVAMLPYLLIIVGVWVFFVWLRRSRFLYRKLAAQGAKIGQPQTAELSDAQFVLRSPGCTAIMEWTYFIRFIETKSAFLLFILPRVGHILPKRAFGSTADLDQFRAFALAHVGNEVIGFPVQPSKAPMSTRDPPNGSK